MPSLIFGCEILIPPADVPWLTSQPDHILTSYTYIDEWIGFKFWSHGVNTLSMSGMARIAREMSRDLLKLQPAILDEVGAYLDLDLGTDGAQWKAVDMMKVVRTVVLRAAQPALLGHELCRDHSIPTALEKSQDTLFCTIMAMWFLLPRKLHHFVRPVVASSLQLLDFFLLRHVIRIVKQRITALDSDSQRKAEGGSSQTSKDVMKLLIENSAREGYARGPDAANIAGTLAFIQDQSECAASCILLKAWC